MLENSFLYDLNCQKEYYFVISLYYYNDKSDENYYLKNSTLSGLLFNIIDAKIDNIILSPELSDIFSFQQRSEDQQEVIFYSHNETKNCLINFDPYSKVKIFKNNEIIYEKFEEKYKKEILLEKDENYTIYIMANYSQNFFSFQLFEETPIKK